MKISVICFTLNGANLCQNLIKALKIKEYDIKAFTLGSRVTQPEIEPLKENLQEWTRRQFNNVDGLVFIGAAGIAVRAIAPFVKDKTKDPAVIVMDEGGAFVIPLLSGHIGGANELASEIASLMGSIPVITTATDSNHKFAVDLFAKRNHLYISRMDVAKEISAAVLNNEVVGLNCDFPILGSVPDSLSSQKDCVSGICISYMENKKPFKKTLNLIPKIITLGIGCRKGKTLDEIETVVFDRLRVNQISFHAVSNVASIDLKKDEEGLLEFCKKYDLKLTTYSAEQLEKAQGTYMESDYVKSVTGIGNVCERAARLGSNNGTVIQKKYAENGVTVSIARKDWSVEF